MRIIKNKEGEYSLIDSSENVIVPFGVYDKIEEIVEGHDWLYKVCINNVILEGINFGRKYGIISHVDGTLIVPLRYEAINIKENHNDLKYLNLVNGKYTNEFYYNGAEYYEVHKPMAEKDIKIIKNFFRNKDDNFIIDIVNEYSSVRLIDAVVRIESDDYSGVFKNIFKGYYTKRNFLIVSKEDGSEHLEGVFNFKGEMIIPCIYNSLKKVSYNGLIEYIQENKKSHKSFYHYSQIQERFNGRCEMLYFGDTGNYKYFITDTTIKVYYLGRPIVEYEDIEDIRHASGHLFSVKKNEKWGVMDINNNVIIPFLYDLAIEFNDGFAIVKRDGLFGVIDECDNVLIEFNYGYMSLEEGLIRCVDLNGLWGVIKMDASVVVPFEYKCLFEISERLIGALNKDNKVGFLNVNNEIAIPFRYWWPEEGSNVCGYEPVFKFGVVSVSNGEKFGFVNHNGEEVIPFKYDYAHPFENFKALCQIDEHNGYGYTEYSYFVSLDGTETLIEEEFHEVESGYFPDFYESYPRRNRYDDRMDAYEDDPEALWNTD